MSTLILDYSHPNAVYNDESKLIFHILRTCFDQMMTKAMNRPGLKFYQDLHGGQGITSCFLEGMGLYAFETLVYVVP